jgi:hypothetical protein
MMHHGEHTIVGLNEDAVLCDEPTCDVLPSKAANLHMALNRLVPGWSSSGHLDIACTKVDLAPSGAARSLNVAIQEAMAGHLCVLPGKMTEAPFATDVLTKMLHERLDTAPIAPRPCDHFRVEPSDARNAA